MTTTVELEALPPTDALASGAAPSVLAEAVCGADGQVLLAAGSTLTPDRIASLKRRGITTVSVVAAECTGGGAEDGDRAAQAHERARERLHHLFRRSLRDGEVNPLLHMLIRHLGAVER